MASFNPDRDGPDIVAYHFREANDAQLAADFADKRWITAAHVVRGKDLFALGEASNVARRLGYPALAQELTKVYEDLRATPLSKS